MRRLRFEAEERPRHEEEQERWEREEVRRRQKEGLDALVAEANRWEKARPIRSYVEARLDAARRNGQSGPDSERWAVLAQAQRIDWILSGGRSSAYKSAAPQRRPRDGACVSERWVSVRLCGRPGFILGESTCADLSQ